MVSGKGVKIAFGKTIINWRKKAKISRKDRKSLLALTSPD
jgi:hypothetical protein